MCVCCLECCVCVVYDLISIVQLCFLHNDDYISDGDFYKYINYDLEICRYSGSSLPEHG